MKSTTILSLVQPANSSTFINLVQVVCMGDLEVVKYDGFWGQGTTPLGAMPPGEVMSSPWLGALEYVLEPVSAGKLASAGQQSSAGQPKQ